jgi:hypothetical protein
VLTGAIMLATAPLLGSFPRMALLYDWVLNLSGVLSLRALASLFSQGTNRESTSPLELLKKKWRGWLGEGAIYYATLGIPLGIYLLTNKLAIGAGMPVSGQIKRWWGEPAMRAYGGPARNSLAFWGVEMGPDSNAWNPLTGWLNTLSHKIAAWQGFYRNDETYIVLLIAAAIAWLAVLALNRHKAVRASMQAGLPLLFAASVIQGISYNATGYSAIKEWYWITEPLFLAPALALATAILIRPLQRFPAARAATWLAVAALSVQLAWNFTEVTAQRMPHGKYPPGMPYLDVVRFLEERTPPGALIGMTGGGNVSYYIKDRTIVNMDGLISSPAYFEALKAGKASEYLQGIGLDYVFANPGILAGTPYRGQYTTGPVLDRFGGKALMEFSP